MVVLNTCFTWIIGICRTVRGPWTLMKESVEACLRPAKSASYWLVALGRLSSSYHPCMKQACIIGHFRPPLQGFRFEYMKYRRRRR